jgi:hypothetical protein
MKMYGDLLEPWESNDGNSTCVAWFEALQKMDQFFITISFLCDIRPMLQYNWPDATATGSYDIMILSRLWKWHTGRSSFPQTTYSGCVMSSWSPCNNVNGFWSGDQSSNPRGIIFFSGVKYFLFFLFVYIHLRLIFVNSATFFPGAMFRAVNRHSISISISMFTSRYAQYL